MWVHECGRVSLEQTNGSWGLMLLTVLPAGSERRQSQPAKELTIWEAEQHTVCRDWHSIKNELQKHSESQGYHKEIDAEKSLKGERGWEN